MLKFIIEVPESSSLKDKRRIVKSLRDKLIRQFRVTAAEVDLHESLRFAEMGVAYVSNSPRLGDSVMQKIINYVEDNVEGTLQESGIYSQEF